MAKKIALSKLNASTLDILNTIRANASLEYQNTVPEITKVSQIPGVGDILQGYPNLANQFISSLLNRIAAVRIKSSIFNNRFLDLKKGYLENGETVEEVFVNIVKAREFSVEKAAAREFKRTLPDVRTAFHVINWRVQYPITIQNQDLKTAFLSVTGVEDMISRIVESVYTSADYDEYLLFKYLMIKAITKGKAYNVGIDSDDMSTAAVAFRGISNNITFLKTAYNASGVHTSTPKEDQNIFMDSMYNAKYDVNVLSAAFNMEKAEYSGKLRLIDEWDSFDNERFDVIRENSEMIEEVTTAELALMKNVKAVLVDTEWFQFYDNLTQFSEVYVSAGLYWNYNLNIWKTVSSSPFSNIVAFVDDSVSTALPATISLPVNEVAVTPNSTIITFADPSGTGIVGKELKFIQTEQAAHDFVAVHRYGALIYDTTSVSDGFVLEVEVNGTKYRSAATDLSNVTLATVLTLTKQ